MQLRDYQIASINGLRDGFANGHKKQVFYLPTGGGKTECAIELLKKCKEKGTKAAMVMDRRVLVYQTSLRLKKYGIEHGIIMNGEPYQPEHLIQICSEQTLATRGGLDGIGLIVLDEAHIFRKSTLDLLNQYDDLKAVGLTATPFTKGLADIYSNVVCKVTTKELVEQKKLINPKYFICTQIDTSKVAEKAGDFDERQLEQQAIIVVADIVKEWQEKTFEHFGKPEKTIVFSSGVEHSLILKEQFAKQGFFFESISYLDKEETKNEIIKEFNKPDSKIVGLISTDILTKGFDCPDVKIGVSARPFKNSFSSHVQQLGRIMRICDGKDKALWLDHSGNVSRFKAKWVYLYYDGVTTLANQEDSKKGEPPTKTCPECDEIIPLGCKHCPECGYEFLPETKPIKTVVGKLEEVDVLSLDAEPITSWIVYPHISRAGNEGFKAVINNSYTKYFAIHTKRGLAEYEKCEKSIPKKVKVTQAPNDNFPTIELIW